MLNKLIALMILVFVLSGMLIGCEKGTAESGNGDISSGEESKLPSGNSSEGGDAENGDTESGGTESGGTEGDNTENGNTVSSGTESGGTEGDNTENGNTVSSGTENGGTEGDNTENDNTVSGGTESGSTSTDDNKDLTDIGGNAGEGEDDNSPTLTIGSAVGNLCPALDLERVGGGTVNIENYRGKVVVVNIWGTWCTPCRSELPDFERIASEYNDVVIIAAHSNSGRENAEAYINANFPNSNTIFAYDTENEDYWSAIGGTRYYPRTVVLDKNGVITYGVDGALSYEALKYLVENAGAGN